MSCRFSKWMCCVLAVLFSVDAFAQSNAWPQFLGPNRNGISNEKGLLREIPKAGLKEVWRKQGGVGMSGISIADGLAVTMLQDDKSQFVVALNAKTGVSVWKTPVARMFKNQMGNGPRATPTISKGRVFAFTGDGQLVALDLKSGKVHWTKTPLTKFGGRSADYGMSSSPLVVDNLVVVTPGTPKATLVAYSQESGAVEWTVGKDPAGYSSPVLLNVGGKRQVVSFTGSSAIGADPKTGTLLWRHPYVTEYDCNISTPLAVDGNVLLSSGENHGSVLLKLKSAGDKFEPEPIWESQGRQSTLRAEWQTSILKDGYLFGLDNVGSAGPVTHLTCVEAKTGKRIWQQKRFGKSNMIYADGKLIFTTMKGEIVFVKADPKGFTELGRQTVLETTRQAPALANGLLYVRDDNDIVCLDIRAK